MMRLLALAAFGLLLAGAVRAQEKVTVALAIPLTVTDGGEVAAAEELGLFRAEGIVPEYIVFQGAGAFLAQIAQKKVLIGLPLTEPVLSSYEPGKAPLPVRFFYNANPYNGLELAVLKSGPIHTIADLRGHAVGVGALTWGTIPQLRSLLRANGLTPGTDTDIVPVGVLGAGFQALRIGRVAALNFNETWTAMLEQQGTPLRRLPFPPTYAHMISNAYVAHEDTVRTQSDLLARFGRVVTEAKLVCWTNPEFCVEAFWRQHPEARPKDADPQKALADAVALVRHNADRALHDDQGHDRVPGQFDLGAIKDYVAALHSSGELATSDIPVDRLFTNDLVPAFSKFDHAALIERARAAR
jgi:NitT/TauT family transport system substrate-binding protein